MRGDRGNEKCNERRGVGGLDLLRRAARLYGDGVVSGSGFGGWNVDGGRLPGKR